MRPAMMRRVGRLLLATGLLLALLVGCQHIRHSAGPSLAPPPADGFRVATYNVHYILVNQTEGRWSRTAWEDRKEPLDATFKALDADIVAFQEMESFAGGNSDDANLARSWLLDRNPGYAAAAIGDWRAFPSTQPVFYRVDRFAAQDQGWFFFSDTPDVIYSRTFDGSYPAFAAWVDLRDRDSGHTVRVLNLHLDYSSAENRRRSTALVAEHVAAWRRAGRAVLLAGDLNARFGSGIHAALEDAGLRFVPVRGATYHFDRGVNLFGAIDHVALSPQLTRIGDAVVYREKLGPVWPTDHYPVVVDVAPTGG